MNQLATIGKAFDQKRLLVIWGDVPFPPAPLHGRQRAEVIRQWRRDVFHLKPIVWPLTALPPVPILSLDPSPRLITIFEQANLPWEIIQPVQAAQAQAGRTVEKHQLFLLGGDLRLEQNLLVTWDDVMALPQRPYAKALLAAASKACRDGVVLTLAPRGTVHFGRIWQQVLAPLFQTASIFGLGPGPWPPDITPLTESPEVVFAALQKPIEPDQDAGPEIIWRGPSDEKELQFFEQRIPEFFDIGYLKRILSRTQSICRIELPEGNPVGTGFLIAKGRVLTNYHVLSHPGNETIETMTRRLILRFHYITSDGGEEAEGITFKLASRRPIVAASPTEKLDYVLLQVEERIQQANQLEPAPYNSVNIPQVGAGLSILHHPQGDPMKFAPGANSVVYVNPTSGLIQYWTKTAKGSSGSPCFDEDGKVVALHHAERARHFGTIREGILFNAIYKEIKDLITQ